MRTKTLNSNGSEVSKALHLVLTAETSECDPVTIQNWKDEGYETYYLPIAPHQKDYLAKLHQFSDELELGDMYAIVAYGVAASKVLNACIEPMPKLCALVAYYPQEIINPGASFPSGLRMMVHLAASQGMGLSAPSFAYLAKPGFAERHRVEYDKVSTGLAWSRSLGVIRKGFDVEVELEQVWENHLALEFATKDADATMATMVAEPYVNHVPTMTGGIGYKDLLRFYKHFFIPGNPPSMKIRLLSRTVGTDRVVDEMHVQFRHTQEIPWMLPGIRPTDKAVEVALVSVVCIRGRKLYHEHIYWDQATVLVQIGLLDPQLVIGGSSAIRLPVVGAESAWKVMDESSVKSNDFIADW